MDYQRLRLAIEGDIARITLARPGDGNRIDARTLDELAAAAEEIAAGDAVALTVLTADGPDFCLGWEDGLRDELLAARRAGTSASIDPFGCIVGLACPVVCVVQGRAVSAGLELALAADIRVCGEDASFSLPDVEMGALPMAGGSQRLPRVVGRSAAASMLLLGEPLDAAGALRCGLVSRVFAGDDLTREAEALVQRIAGRGPIGLRYAKEAVHQGIEMSLDQGLRYELDLSVILQTTADRAEGVNAFLEKRPPQFRGE